MILDAAFYFVSEFPKIFTQTHCFWLIFVAVWECNTMMVIEAEAFLVLVFN